MPSQPQSTAEQAREPPQPTLLLVDDNPQNLRMLYETLSDRGYRLLIANDGPKALALAERNQPDLILLDIMMPVMDGFEVCKKLKTNPATQASAVIFLSALDDVDSKVKSFELGGVDYIAKPFQAPEVIARVETHLQLIRLKRELQQRNRQLEGDQASILNAISEGIYGLDSNGNIVFANPAAADLCGAAVEDLIGTNFFATHFDNRLLPARGDAAGSEQQLAGPVPGWSSCRFGIAEHRRHVLMQRQDGSCFPIEYRATPKRDQGNAAGAVVVFRDITQELASEAELEQVRATVQEQRDQLAHASRLSTMGEMAAGFAHEVNQPLTAVTNYSRVSLRLLSAGQLDRPLLAETLRKIEAQAQRASEIIRRIRGFVKKPASGRETFSVDDMLKDLKLFAEVDAKNAGLLLEISAEANLPDLLADPIQVQQVALNLVRNALEATRAAGRDTPVQVFAGRASATLVRIDVVDSGVGLVDDAEQQVFLPFFSTKQTGMGIGLSLSRNLVQAQGGDIGFERRAEGGTRFWFTLPVSEHTK